MYPEQGLILTLPMRINDSASDLIRDIDILEMMKKLINIATEIRLVKDFCEDQYVVSMKSSWEMGNKVLCAIPDTYFPGLDYLDIQRKKREMIQEPNMCYLPGCFNGIAQRSCTSITVPLFDQHGEEFHELSSCCRHHCKPATLALAKTLEVEEVWISKDETYWTKILSWSSRSHKHKHQYFAQMVIKDQDGDYESGYHDYLAGSPHYGPAITRAEAIELAKEHKF